MDNRIVTLTLRCPESLARQARVAAALQNRSRSDLVREAIQEHLAKLDGQNQTQEVGDSDD